MNDKTVISISELTLDDFLTVDIYDRVIRVRKKKDAVSEPLISKETFFRGDGLYVKPQRRGLKIIPNVINDYDDKQSGDYITFKALLKEIDNAQNTFVLLIEGYAGCGKSTLVQAILFNKFGFVPEYGLYNYNIEQQNNEEIYNEEGIQVKNSSIFNAIKRIFRIQFCKYCNEVYDDFMNLIHLCRDNSDFSDVYEQIVVKRRVAVAKDSIEKNDLEEADVVLAELLSKITNANTILAIDYLFRLALFRKGIIRSLYICYDNVDAIEDAADLKDFDNKLITFRDKFDFFLEENGSFFNNVIPHFVIIVTYRKITAELAELDKSYNEVGMDRPGIKRIRNLRRIDATSTFSYNTIVSKRRQYFEHYFKKEFPFKEELSKDLWNELNNLIKWDELNKNLKIMKDKYSVLWNRNYRTCSFIAEILFSNINYNYRFDQYISFINSLSALDDGYTSEKDETGESTLCTYFGKSAILLNCVCRVFKNEGIWDGFLNLTKLHQTAPERYMPFYRDVSLSRLILTYTYNKRVAKLEDLYNVFCSKDIFTIDELCDCLSNMIARNAAGVWRRPIYYYGECILASKAKDICEALLSECKRMKNGSREEHNYSFQLCDSGKAYVERIMSEFEFYSSRLPDDNHKDYLPLYMYKNDNIRELSRVLNNVYCSVHNCCMNMIAFRNEYIKRYQILPGEYLTEDFHPKTNRGSRQLHTERIIFSHIAYLNNARLYYVKMDSDMRREYNSLFVKQIKKYLDLYHDYIYTLSRDRGRVYEGLYAKVTKIETEEQKDNPDDKVLYESISIK